MLVKFLEHILEHDKFTLITTIIHKSLKFLVYIFPFKKKFLGKNLKEAEKQIIV